MEQPIIISPEYSTRQFARKRMIELDDYAVELCKRPANGRRLELQRSNAKLLRYWKNKFFES